MANLEFDPRERNPLLPHDLQTPVWIKLRDHYTARLATLRASNDGNLDEIETAKVRGRIAECKVFLALGESPIPEQVADD